MVFDEMICLQCGAQMEESRNGYNCPTCGNFHIKAIKDDVMMKQKVIAERKQGYICFLCRVLKEVDKDQHLTFGTNELQRRICKDCVKELFREGLKMFTYTFTADTEEHYD